MKNCKVFVGVFLLLALLVFPSCKKEKGAEVPTLTTSEVTNITGASATCGGTITDEGSGTIVERGVCWSKGIKPATTDSKTIEGGGAGTFVCNISNLDATTTYYIRAYAVNDAGTGYGMAMSFTTLGLTPVATTQQPTGITQTSAILNGVINPNSLQSTVTFEYGTTTGYGQALTAAQSPVTGSSNTDVTAELSGLLPGTTYHFRIKITNLAGTIYGSDISFTTSAQTVTATTQPASGVTTETSILNGAVNPNNLSTAVSFDYGKTTGYGQTITAAQSPVTGNSNINISAGLSGLLPGTTYHFRVKVANSLGTIYGNDLSFTTQGQLPTASTQPASGVTATGAILNGVINPNFLATIVTFEYGETASYGQEIIAAQSPVTGNSDTKVTAGISGFIPETAYHFRVKATNSLGTAYGNDFSFTTTFPSVTDIDGNVYKIATIGTQVWMKENLKVTRYRNGDIIGTTTPATANFSGDAALQWSYKEAIAEFSNSLATLITSGGGNMTFDQMVKAGIIKQPAKIVYENQLAALGIPYNVNMTALAIVHKCDSVSGSVPEVYGRLYTWYAVVDTRYICPEGWHIPADTDWTTLVTFLGGDASAGGKLKESGLIHWNSPNTGATNESGFNGLPAGWRDVFAGDSFKEFGSSEYWWSSTEVYPANGSYRAVYYNSEAMFKNNYDKKSGFSVRCLKD